jgi:hypothetical protein
VRGHNALERSQRATMAVKRWAEWTTRKNRTHVTGGRLSDAQQRRGIWAAGRIEKAPFGGRKDGRSGGTARKQQFRMRKF